MSRNAKSTWTPGMARRCSSTSSPHSWLSSSFVRSATAGRLPGAARLEAHQLLPVGSAGHGHGENRADVLRVELVLDEFGLERCRVPRHEHARVGPERNLGTLVDAEDFTLVFRL